MKKALLWFALFLVLIVGTVSVHAEDDHYIEAWVLCQPDSYINIRSFAKKDAAVAGYLWSGDRIWLDGKSRKGFMHCVGMGIEPGDGWVAKGYIVYSEPREDGHVYRIDSNGRVAARRTVGGTRRRWMRNGDEVTVYMVSGEWCLTSQGFIKTDCIDLTTPIDIDNMDPDDMMWEED